MSTWAPQVSEVAQEVIGSVEVGGVWHIACVEKVVVPNKPQQQHIKLQNTYHILSDDDDEDECNDCMSWPVVGQGGRVKHGKRGVWKKGKR